MQTETTSAQRKLITEMEAPELLAKARELNAKIDTGSITDNEIKQLSTARALYQKKTGRMLNAKELRYS